MAFTKVSPAGIGSTPGDGYRIGDSFLHSTGVEITNINATGILTAASLDISGAIDFDGHTELDNVNISGVSTFAGNIDANGDLDVDGHTNLDNVSVAGVTTFSDDVKFTGNNYNVLWDKSDNSLKFDALAKIKLNDSFQFYHNTNGVLHNTSGTTYIYGSGSGAISLMAQAGSQNISCNPNANTSLYYANGQKLYTVSDGVYINDNLGIQDSIQHILDTNTKIRFPSNDTITAETAGTERLRITSTGKLEVKGTRAGDLQASDDDTLQLYTKSTNNSINRGSGITFYNHDGSGYEMGGTIQVAKENGTVDNVAAYMRFSTRPAGGSATERLRITSSGNLKLPDGGEIQFGGALDSGNGDLRIHHDGSDSNIWDTGTGNLNINATSLNFNNNDIGGRYIECASNSHVKLFFAGSERLSTTTQGVNVTGISTFNAGDINGITFPLNVKNNNNDNDYDMGTGIKLQGGSSTEFYKWCAIVARGENAGAGGYSNTQALAFYTYDNAGASGGTERLRITSKGLLLGGSDAQGNTTLGGNAGNSFSGTSAINNTLIGYDAGTAITSGDQSVAVGYNALKSLTSGGNCTAIGAYALEDNTGNANTAIGNNSMKENVSGYQNTAIGYDSLVNSIGNLNVAIGYYAMKASNHNAGHDNVVLGAYAATGALHMYRNVIIGRSAIDQSTSNLSIHNNVIIGYEAGRRLSHYIGHNVILGSHAMDGGGTGGGLANQYNLSDNIAIGRYAFQNVKHTSNNNIIMGQEAAQNAATGSGTYSNYTHNIAIGYRAQRDATGGADNVVSVGSNSLEFHTGDGDASSGGYTVAFGNSAFRNNRHIRHSVAVGNQAGSEWNAVKGAMHEGGCTFLGGGAGRTCSTATSAIAIGRDAMAGSGPATGSHNTAIGSRALERITSGTNNCAVGGLYTGLMLTTGDYNNFFGSLAGYAYNVNTGATGDHNNIFGGYSAASSNNDHENIFGGGLTGKGGNTTYIKGNVYNSVNSSSFSTTSDERIKKNIVDNNTGLDAIEKIRVRNFEYRTKDEITDFDNPEAVVVKDKEGVQLGVIAQEIKDILPDVVKQNTTGAYAVDPDNLTWYLVNAVKELSAEVKSLKAQINS